MTRPCLSYFPPLLLLTLGIAVATNTVCAQPSQRDIPYFVDAAGTEYDLEQEVKALDRISKLPRAEQLQAAVQNNVRLRLYRWRVYLRSDGTWAPDPDSPPGSTHPVAEIVPSPGKAAIMPSEFHGRTVNGRRVVLSTDPAGVTSWRFDGPEPSVPDEAVLAAELKAYIETTNDNTMPEGSACSPEQGRVLLRSSLAGPYHFFRTPYSSKIAGEFLAAETSNDGTVYNQLLFARGEQGWKLLRGDCRIPWRQYETGSRRNTKISEFVGKAVLQKETPVVLRRDGTWDSDDPSALQLPEYIEKSFIGYDMNGAEIDFRIDDQGRATWRRLNDQTVPIRVETVISELSRALGRYIELLSAGNIEGFLAEGGEQNDAYEFYRTIERYGDDSKQANEVYDFLKQTGDGQGLVREYGESNFKQPMKKWLLAGAIRSVDGPLTLQELKRLRNETPRIVPRVPFSPDFEALYALHPEDPAQSQTVRRLTGHGSTWAVHWD